MESIETWEEKYEEIFKNEKYENWKKKKKSVSMIDKSSKMLKYSETISHYIAHI